MSTTNTASHSDYISVKETARRTFRSSREISRLVKSGKLDAERLNDEDKSPYIVYWPSVVEYYQSRGIVFPPAPSP
jgi:hypothetical protein